ncbi:MAG: hypothetical protein M5U18_18835 [Dehalococcoidia bacterium]|nr:hypothetical protein [Dehalococcoidia bacterium]
MSDRAPGRNAWASAARSIHASFIHAIPASRPSFSAANPASRTPATGRAGAMPMSLSPSLSTISMARARLRVSISQSVDRFSQPGQ